MAIQFDNSATGTVTLRSPSSGTPSFTLPSADGTSGQVMQTNGSGVLSFATVAVANGGTGATSQTAYAVLCGGTTSTGAYQSIAGVGTSGQVLTSNGAGALPTFQDAGGGFAAGTRMIFAQDAAPTGWTKDTTNYNNHALRIVTGTAGTTGGTVDFTTAFASQTPSGSVSVIVSGTVGSTTLATSQIPSHTHSYTAPSGGGSADVGASGPTNTTAANTGATGGGGSHDHSFSGSGSGSFSGNAINLAVKYLNVITATKN